jgi:hypothetical protein
VVQSIPVVSVSVSVAIHRGYTKIRHLVARMHADNTVAIISARMLGLDIRDNGTLFLSTNISSYWHRLHTATLDGMSIFDLSFLQGQKRSGYFRVRSQGLRLLESAKGALKAEWCPFVVAVFHAFAV